MQYEHITKGINKYTIRTVICTILGKFEKVKKQSIFDNRKKCFLELQHNPQRTRKKLSEKPSEKTLKRKVSQKKITLFYKISCLIKAKEKKEKKIIKEKTKEKMKKGTCKKSLNFSVC